MLSKIITSSVVATLLLAAPAYAQITIGGKTIPQEQATMLEDYCRTLLLDAGTEGGDDNPTTATAADPTGTGNTVDTANAGTSEDFADITVSDCRDAGYAEPSSDTTN